MSFFTIADYFLYNNPYVYRKATALGAVRVEGMRDVVTPRQNALALTHTQLCVTCQNSG